MRLVHESRAQWIRVGSCRAAHKNLGQPRQVVADQAYQGGERPRGGLARSLVSCSTSRTASTTCSTAALRHVDQRVAGAVQHE